MNNHPLPCSYQPVFPGEVGVHPGGSCSRTAATLGTDPHPHALHENCEWTFQPTTVVLHWKLCICTHCTATVFFTRVVSRIELIGASLSEPHTSVTALQNACVCLLACLLACLLVAIYRKFKLNKRIHQICARARARLQRRRQKEQEQRRSEQTEVRQARLDRRHIQGEESSVAFSRFIGVELVT